jgi:hypothetical protein
MLADGEDGRQGTQGLKAIANRETIHASVVVEGEAKQPSRDAPKMFNEGPFFGHRPRYCFSPERCGPASRKTNG